MVPLDERAAEAVRARGGSDLSAWMAAVGGGKPLRIGGVGISHGSVSFGPPRTEMSVGEVALAVDGGRDAVAREKERGTTVFYGYASNADGERLARWLLGEAADAEIRGPLGALRRLGDHEEARLAGLALGAGEHGIGYVCGDLAAIAAAGIAIAVEPDLRPRVRAADRSHADLLERIGIEPVVENGGLNAALRALANA